MGKVRTPFLLLLLFFHITAISIVFHFGNSVVAQQHSEERRTIADGVYYSHLKQTSSSGEPWSIHVLRVSRRARNTRIRAAQSMPGASGMQRQLPTQIAAQSDAAGESVLGVVNGDYDLPAPYLGVSDGLSISSGRISTTGKPAWPAFAILTSGTPVIDVPSVAIELRAGKRRRLAAALNKPFGAAFGPGSRLFTREFRPSVGSDGPLRVAMITNLSAALPLRAGRPVRGVVTQIVESSGELKIPEAGLAYAEPAAMENAVVPLLRVGDKLTIRVTIRMHGRGNVREIIGGFPVLVRKGRAGIEGTPSDYLRRRHPRTAVCYNREYVMFTVVDGRQPQLSVGMTLEELAALQVSLGCTAAMNTDGGGSSVMAVTLPPQDGATSGTGVTPREAPEAARLRIVNSPSDGRERGRGNAWVVVKMN